MWQIDIIGDALDIGALKALAALCDCAIAPGPDGRDCLGGARFEKIDTAHGVLEAARAILALLNGLARIEHSNHRPVQLGAGIARVRSDGGRDVDVGVIGIEARGRVSAVATVIRADGSIADEAPTETRDARLKRVACDPKLAEIAEALGGEKSWQRLRVAFEKINALVGKGDNALVKHGYATQGELDQFKANVQDPRHSGLDAVHGVAKTPVPKGTKMTKEQGFAFVVRLLNAYLDKNPA
jgi:hypothetical protein